MDSSSDDDAFQLYRFAENVKLKRMELQPKLLEFEKNLNSKLALDLVDLSQENSESWCESPVKLKSYRSRPVKSDFLSEPIDSDLDDTPLSQRDLNAPLSQTASPKARRSKRVKPNCSQNDNKLKGNKSKKRPRSKRNNTKPHESATSALISNVIILDDDSDFNQSLSPIEFFSQKKHGCENSMDGRPTEFDSDEEIDDTITLSVEWSNGGKISHKKFFLRKYQKLENVFEQIAKIEGVSISRILLMRNFTSVNPSDTPELLGFKFYGSLTGSVSDTDIAYDGKYLTTPSKETSHKSGDEITVKVQLQTQQILSFSVFKHQRIDLLYKKVAEEVKCKESCIKISFDGEFADPTELFSSLGVEDEDMFHVHVKSS